MRFAGNNLACARTAISTPAPIRTGLPLVGVVQDLSEVPGAHQRVVSPPERLNECMTRSMNGRKLPDGFARDGGAPGLYALHRRSAAGIRRAGPPARCRPTPAAAPEVFATVCAVCHQANGLGKRMGSANDARGYVFPPLWGPDSFNDGAGMDRYQNIVWLRAPQHAARRRSAASAAQPAAGSGTSRPTCVDAAAADDARVSARYVQAAASLEDRLGPGACWQRILAADLGQRARVVLLRLLRPRHAAERHLEALGLPRSMAAALRDRPRQEQRSDLFLEERHQGRRQRRPRLERTFDLGRDHALHPCHHLGRRRPHDRAGRRIGRPLRRAGPTGRSRPSPAGRPA